MSHGDVLPSARRARGWLADRCGRRAHSCGGGLELSVSSLPTRITSKRYAPWWITSHQRTSFGPPCAKLPSRWYQQGLERYAVWPVHGDGPFALPKPMLCDASDELQRFAYVHVAPRVDDPARTYADALEGCWPSHSSWSAGRARSTLYKLRRVVKCRGARCDRCRPSCGTARLALWPEGVGMRRRRPPRIGSWRRRSVMRPVWARLSLTGRVLCAADFERHNRNPGRGDTVASSMHRRQNGAIRPAPGMARYRAHGGIPAVLGAATCVGRDRNAQSGHRTARDLFARARWQNLFRQEQHWWQSRRVSW